MTMCQGRRSHWPKCLKLILLVLSAASCAPRVTPDAAYERARTAFRSGDLVNAEKLSNKGYEDFHHLGAEWSWKFLIIRARTLYRQGHYEEALRLVSTEPSTPPNTDLTLRKLWVEALSYTSLHQFPKAEQIFRDGEAACKGSSEPACAELATARGTMEMELGHYSDAEKFFQQVLGPARASGNQLWLANAMLDLSWSADEQGHFDEALDWASHSAQVAQQENFAAVSETATGNMGWAFYKLGDREKARQMFKEAEGRAKKLGGVDDQINWLTAAAYVSMDERNFAGAEDSFREALDLARKIKSREDIVNSLIAFAFVSEQVGKIDDAKRYANEALSMALADGNKRDQTYPLLILGRIAARRRDSRTAQSDLQQVADSTDSPVFLEWEAERSLARLYEDQKHVDEADSEYRTALSTFERARSALQHETSRLPFITNASSIYDDYLHFVLTRGETDRALQIADYSRARALSEGLKLLKKTDGFHPDALNAKQIARHAGGTILFYWLGPTESHLWAVTPQTIQLFSLPAASRIDALVERYRRALLGPLDPLENSNSDGIELFHILIEPALSLIPSGSRVFVIPDGSLNNLNFETLLASKPKPHYWIEDVAIADASSLRLLAATPPAKTGGSLLLLGDPVVSNPDYPELQKASVEMKGIQKHFSLSARKVLARHDATPGAYLGSNPEQFSYVHFVAHGTASRISPLESAIVLSGTGAQDDSFKLYARDIIQRPLHAELVTISTCYGAGARAYSGEGLVGLSWAFLRAGAHNVIGALWEVSDVSTPQLMDDLYAGLGKGQPPQSALRAAKLAMLHSNGSFRRPFYWAPFQLYTGS